MISGNGKWSVPGSLLIAGEYIVTGPDGPGLALAAGGRAYLNIQQTEELLIESSGPKQTERWTPSRKNDGSLISAVYEECLGSGMKPVEYRRYLKVDTGEFYERSGRKLGYGSSAAAAVLLSRGLLKEDDGISVSRTALRAHRRWQRGRGSGYDILTSFHGGAGCFSGGETPRWTPFDWPEGLKFWLIRGRQSVNSPDSVKKYNLWVADRNTRSGSDSILAGMKSEMRIISASAEKNMKPESGDFLDFIHTMAQYGRELGRAIGVPADPVIPGFGSESIPFYRPGQAVAKCLGAGDEVILLAALPDGLTLKESDSLKTLEHNGIAAELKRESEGLIQEDSE